jgi:hypothetical protein
LKVVTLVQNDTLRTVHQYVAAVFEREQSIQVVPNQYVVQRTPEPWASADLVLGDPTAYRLFRMPSHTWMTHFSQGMYIGALINNLDLSIPAPEAPEPPEAINGTMEWRASINYVALLGECSFLDFNWMTLFETKNPGKDPLRIVVVSNPPPVAPSTQPPMVAKVIGRPIATTNGVIYDSIRILKLADSLEPGEFVFEFQIVDTKDQKTDVTLTLTVV